ncbi:aldo/keto reductase [Francisella tularensis subsp. novicida]|uniref:aldo/keto reductase n=1 Tax=Francisella tularensis TaxID=263 RepID=UPI000CE291FD|nr:aldo/keto reductase [Francisella tularensis]AVC44393.1 aldo/keto reductase [Francisella tularensis subsp. novicida]
MKYTKLGKTRIDISRICLGTMTWGRQNTQAEGFEQMDYALAQGINFWDTAEMYAIPPTAKTYGKTEEIIGNWFKTRQKRSDVILATKFSPMTWARNEQNPITNKVNIIDAVDNSLKRLQTDYIDLYQFHWPTNRPHYHFGNWWDFEPLVGQQNKQRIIDNIHEILVTCDELVKAGKIRHIGLSNDSAWGINQFIKLAEKHNLPRLVSIQHEYNLNRRRDETDIMETCALEEISYLAWSPLEQGVLTGKYRNGARPAGTRMSAEILDGQEDRYAFRFATNDDAVTAYINVAKKHNLDICQMAIAFTIRKAYMSCSIIGATSMEQLKTNIEAINLNLSDEVLADIEKVRRKYPVPF